MLKQAQELLRELGLPETEKNIRLAFYAVGATKTMEDYAIWRSGEQVIGCMQRPLKVVVEEMLKNISWEKENEQQLG